MAATLTPGQQDQLIGIQARLDIHGRWITTESAERFFGLIQDQAVMFDPTQQARAETPVYVLVTALSDAVDNPRTVTTFTEADYGTMRVLEYKDSRGDALTLTWLCEAQRQ